MRSVVLATYQGERFIGAQLDSILAQLSSEDEVVVSDDGSTDATVRVIAERGDKRVRVIDDRTRLGYVGNFQRAITSSRGDIVLFSDQDDIWLPDKVAAIDAALQDHSCVASDAIVVDECLRTIHSSYFACRGAKRFTRLSIYLRPSIVGATVACRRDYLQSVLPFPAGVPHDFWLTLNAVIDETLCVLDRPLILYRRHSNALSVSATGRRRSLRTIVTERTVIAAAMFRRRVVKRLWGPR